MMVCFYIGFNCFCEHISITILQKLLIICPYLIKLLQTLAIRTYLLLLLLTLLLFSNIIKYCKFLNFKKLIIIVW